MVAALALAYTFTHDKDDPKKAVALLQTEQGEFGIRRSARTGLGVARRYLTLLRATQERLVSATYQRLLELLQVLPRCVQR